MNSKLVPIFLIVLVDVLGMSFIVPLLPFYAKMFGANAFTIGVLFSVFSLCQLVSGPILGKLSDQIGRKKVLLLSQAGSFLGYLILGCSHSLTTVFVARIVEGVTAGNISVAQAYMSDITSEKERTKAFSLIAAAFGIGFLIGPGISAFLFHWSYLYPIFGAMSLSGISIVTTFFLIPQQDSINPRLNQEKKFFKNGVKSASLFILLGLFFAFQMAFSTYFSGIILYLGERFSWHGIPFGPEQVGYLFTYNGLLGTTLQLGVLSLLNRRLGEKKLILVGLFMMSLGYASLSWISKIPALVLTMTLGTIGSAVVRPTLSSRISQESSSSRQGEIMGLMQSLTSLTQILAPLLSGYLILNHQLSLWAWIASGLAFFALLLGLKLFIIKRV